MVNRIRRDAAGTAGQTKDTENSSKLLSSPRPRSIDNNDELIVSLAERYENRRARQVGEWERLYGQNVYRAF